MFLRNRLPEFSDLNGAVNMVKLLRSVPFHKFRKISEILFSYKIKPSLMETFNPGLHSFLVSFSSSLRVLHILLQSRQQIRKAISFNLTESRYTSFPALIK